MSKFRKPALSTAQQVDLLVRRGMQVADRLDAERHLEHINYYRLRAYWLPFERAGTSDGDHRFVDGTSFETVLAIYDFDRRLRLLLIDAIERIEISLRTRLANVLSLRHGPFVHGEPTHFLKLEFWQRCRDELLKEYRRSHETFAAHYRDEYPELATPPLWVACELMTLGHLSRWLQNIRTPADRQAIADAYGLDERALVSFAHHLTIVRNHCAHHGRIWNRRFTLKMQIPAKKPAGLSASFHSDKDRYVYNTLTMLAFLLHRVSPASEWPRRVMDLISTMPEISTETMGFPADWRRRPVWAGMPT